MLLITYINVSIPFSLVIWLNLNETRLYSKFIFFPQYRFGGGGNYTIDPVSYDLKLYHKHILTWQKNF